MARNSACERISPARRNLLPLLAFAALLQFASCSTQPVARNSETASAIRAQLAAFHFPRCTSPPTARAALLAPPKIAGEPGYRELKVSVTGPAGASIPALGEKDFVAESSGVPVPIVYFQKPADTPVSLGILVDSSGSMTRKLRHVHDVIAGFLAKSNPCDEIFLFAFTNRPFLMHPLTTDHAAVASALMTIRHPYGPTGVYDAIFDGLKILQHGRYSDRALLVITDGIDNVSVTTLNQVSALARQQQVPIYVIGIGNPSTPPTSSSFEAITDVDANVLNRLASSARGKAYIVPLKGDAFARAVASIDRRLGRDYTIGVLAPVSAQPLPPSAPNLSANKSPPESGIRVAVVNHPGVVATVQRVAPARP